MASTGKPPTVKKVQKKGKTEDEALRKQHEEERQKKRDPSFRRFEKQKKYAKEVIKGQMNQIIQMDDSLQDFYKQKKREIKKSKEIDELKKVLKSKIRNPKTDELRLEKKRVSEEFCEKARKTYEEFHKKTKILDDKLKALKKPPTKESLEEVVRCIVAVKEVVNRLGLLAKIAEKKFIPAERVSIMNAIVGEQQSKAFFEGVKNFLETVIKKISKVRLPIPQDWKDLLKMNKESVFQLYLAAGSFKNITPKAERADQREVLSKAFSEIERLRNLNPKTKHIENDYDARLALKGAALVIFHQLDNFGNRGRLYKVVKAILENKDLKDLPAQKSMNKYSDCCLESEGFGMSAENETMFDKVQACFNDEAWIKKQEPKGIREQEPKSPSKPAA